MPLSCPRLISFSTPLSVIVHFNHYSPTSRPNTDTLYCHDVGCLFKPAAQSSSGVRVFRQLFNRSMISALPWGRFCRRVQQRCECCSYLSEVLSGVFSSFVCACVLVFVHFLFFALNLVDSYPCFHFSSLLSGCFRRTGDERSKQVLCRWIACWWRRSLSCCFCSLAPHKRRKDGTGRTRRRGTTSWLLGRKQCATRGSLVAKQTLGECGLFVSVSRLPRHRQISVTRRCAFARR